MIQRLLLLLSLCLPLAATAQEILEVDQAYRLSARALDAGALEIRYDIADGYYMYRDKFKFALDPETVKAGTPQFPAGKVKEDEFFGKVETYRKEVVVRLPFTAPDGLDTVTLKASSQGCADIGVCYPPTTQNVTIALAAAGGGSAAPVAAREPAGGAPELALDESAQVAKILGNASFWVVIASFYGFGLLLAFTPCVLPMVPILAGIIFGQGHAISRTRAWVLSSSYGLGMAVTYAAAGVAAGLSGTMLSSALQNPWVLFSFGAVFVALALSMFGFYELQMPAGLQSRLSETTSKQKGGSITGVTIMGALSAIIVGPCVAAPLAGALLYIAQTGDAVLGGSALFAMALGMGLPLIVVAVSARSLLPKIGVWMEGVKTFFGVMMLAVAIWIVSPVIPQLVNMLAWAALLILSAIYLHALDPLPAHARGWHRFWKGVGVVSLLTGASLLVGALAGSRDPLQPLAALRGGAGEVAAELKFERVRTSAELDARLAAAGRPVMLDFYADWCVSCKEMEKFTFTDAGVAARMRRMVLLQADVTANTEEDKTLLKRFNLFGPPGIIFFDARGREHKNLHVVGYQPADRFAKILDVALGG